MMPARTLMPGAARLSDVEQLDMGSSTDELEEIDLGTGGGSSTTFLQSAKKLGLAVGLLCAAAAVCAWATPSSREGPASPPGVAGGQGSLATLYDTSLYATAPPTQHLASDAEKSFGVFSQKASAQAGTTAAPGSKSKGACKPGEEEFAGLCYKQCAILTNGNFKKRFAPDGCCKEFSLKCALPSERSMKGYRPGSGYIVGGDGGEPHLPGTCDANEEEHLGLCYKQCNLLTDGDYPRRWMTNTCCKAGKWCINPFNTKTLGVPGACSGFGVGGGLNGHDCPHKAKFD